MSNSPHWTAIAGSDRDRAALAVAAGFAGLLCASVASNLPTRQFDRLRRHRVPFRLWMPGWRLFAPDPDGCDYSLLFRTRSYGGEVSAWDGIRKPAERSWQHMVVSPGRREAKSLSVVIQNLLADGRRLHSSTLPGTRSYRMIESYVRRHVTERDAGTGNAEGFQFVVVRHTGYDDTEQPLYLLVSAYAAV
jgi:hypothetical protein